MKDNGKQKATERKYVLVLIGAIIFGFAAPTLPFLIFNDSQINPTFWLKIQKLGPIGDYLAGTMVPVLTFSGFIVLVLTTIMQRQELNLTRKELSDTRSIISEQNKTMILERFENTFFHLLSLHNEIVKGIALNNPEIPNGVGLERVRASFTGRASFPMFKHILFRTFINDDTYLIFYDNDTHGLHQLYLNSQEIYVEFFNKNSQELGHYFRNLFRFIKFIDEYTQISDLQKEEYVDLIRAQLSSDEQVLLFYNCLSSLGEPFLHYIKKYDLLDGVLSKEYFHNDLVLEIYNNFYQVKQRDRELNELNP